MNRSFRIAPPLPSIVLNTAERSDRKVTVYRTFNYTS